MSKDGLTAKQVEHMKPGTKRVEVPVGSPIGLYLVIHPTGRKSWMFRYRYRGRTRGLTLEKSYPEMSLAAARAEAEAALEKLADDIDPAVAQAIEEQQAAPNSAKAVAEEWLKRTMQKKPSYGEVKRIVERDILPAWKDRFIIEIDRPAVFRLLDDTVDRGAPVLANRMLTIIKRWFKWSVNRGYIAVSPAAGIDPPSEESSRDRVLTQDELAVIWNTAPKLGFPFGDYFRFLILTGQRRAEVATIRWPHIDLDNALWTLPKANTKSKRIHDVPLSPAAVDLLKRLPRFPKPKEENPTTRKEPNDFVFTTTSGERPISGYSKAKETLEKKITERLREHQEKPVSRKHVSKDDLALDEWHIHDIRRTLTTWMANNDVAPHVLAAILNHTPGSTMGITAVYARSRWAKEKREALDKWATFVLSLEKSEEQNTSAATA